MSDWKTILTALTSGRTLSREQAFWALDSTMSGGAEDAHIAALAVAVRVRGETTDEIAGFVAAMMAHAAIVDPGGPALDIVGTGGDGANSVNVSTMACLVAAGAGARILKHGSRAVSSKTGSSEVLGMLGIAVPIPVHLVRECLDTAGIAYMFAPAHHPSMRYVAQVRKTLAVPTVFNVLGPLANPGQPQAALIGVADSRMASIFAEVQAERGLSSIIVRGDDGLDEMTTATTTQVWDVTNGSVRHTVLDARTLGLPSANASDLRGGEPQENAAVVHEVLAGGKDGRIGAIRNVVALNAATGLVAFDAASGEQRYGSVDLPLPQRIQAALPAAFAAIDNGSAAQALTRWAAVSQRLALLA